VVFSARKKKSVHCLRIIYARDYAHGLNHGTQDGMARAVVC
jgi:hypothetical protein